MHPNFSSFSSSPFISSESNTALLISTKTKLFLQTFDFIPFDDSGVIPPSSPPSNSFMPKVIVYYKMLFLLSMSLTLRKYKILTVLLLSSMKLVFIWSLILYLHCFAKVDAQVSQQMHFNSFDGILVLTIKDAFFKNIV